MQKRSISFQALKFLSAWKIPVGLKNGRKRGKVKYGFQARQAAFFMVLYITEACIYSFEACKKCFYLLHPFCFYLSAGINRFADPWGIFARLPDLSTICYLPLFIYHIHYAWDPGFLFLPSPITWTTFQQPGVDRIVTLRWRASIIS